MKQNLTLRIVVSTLALLIAGLHVLWPDVKIDSIAVVLFVISAVPWLQPLVKTVEVPGLKLELQDLKEKVAEAKGAAESASNKAVYALSASNASSTSPPQFTTANANQAEVDALAREYEGIRKTQLPGDNRTRAMTDVIRRMIELAGSMESFDVAGTLFKESRGLRLFAY